MTLGRIAPSRTCVTVPALPSRTGNRRRVGGLAERCHDVGPELLFLPAGEFRFVFWICDSRMEHGHEGESESFRDDSELAEGQITLIELAVGDPFLDQFVDQLLDFLWRRFLQTARRA